MIPSVIRQPQPKQGLRKLNRKLYECQPRAWEGGSKAAQGHFRLFLIQREGQRHRWMDGQIGRYTDRQQTERHIFMQNSNTDMRIKRRMTERQTDRITQREKYRQVDRLMYRQVDRRTD